MQVNFIVVEAYSPYTAILARPQLHFIRAVSSTLQPKVKYPTEGRVKELVGSQTMAGQCLVAAIRQQSLDKASSKSKKAPKQLIDPEGDLGTEQQGLLCEELDKVMIGSDGDRYFQVGAQLPPVEKYEFIGFLNDNVDVLA